MKLTTFASAAALAVAGVVLALSAPMAAAASATPQLTASPTSIAVGDVSTITATGLGGLETASFGLDATPGGELSVGNNPSQMSVDAPVSNGTSTVNFSAIQSGTFTVSVGDGENVLATVQVTVTGDAPAQQATVSADPASIEVGGTTTVTATGLGGLETAFFGLGDTSSGEFAGGSTSAEASVTDGTATIEFTAATAGEVTISVGDGETVLGTTSVTVSAPAPSPTPTSSPTPDPAPASVFDWTIVWVVLGVLILGALITIIVLLARRRSSGGDGAAPSA